MKKFAKESLTIMTNFILPNDTNAFNTLFGGELLAIVDRACAMSATRHSERKAVTVAVNHVSFDKPIPLGSILVVEAKVSRSFGSSMEIFVDCWVDDPITKHKYKSNQAIYTFVALDENHKPVTVPELIPETELEIERFNSALIRRQLNLLLAGKIKPSEASELKKMFY